MNVEEIYLSAGALLEGHFLLSSGNHSKFYLQSAKVLENPQIAQDLAKNLAKQILDYGLKPNCVCSPAIGGILAGYELARALGVRFIFTERINGEMTLRRGFSVDSSDNIIICEDIITTGGSALESAKCVETSGANILGFSALANRGFCARVNGLKDSKIECKLPNNVPFFALADFDFTMYAVKDCPMCATGSKAIKPGSRGN